MIHFLDLHCSYHYVYFSICLIQTIKTGGLPYSDSSPYELSEFSLPRVLQHIHLKIDLNEACCCCCWYFQLSLQVKSNLKKFQSRAAVSKRVSIGDNKKLPFKATSCGMFRLQVEFFPTVFFQRILTYVIMGGSITVLVASCFTGSDSTKQVNLLIIGL